MEDFKDQIKCYLNSTVDGKFLAKDVELPILYDEDKNVNLKTQTKFV
jgi:hypothetical protein